MTTSRLSKSDEGFWQTEAYVLLLPGETPRAAKDAEDPSYGYEIVNRDTGQVEMRIDQEPQGLMAMLWMQEQYEEIMGDPEREFVRRRPRQSSGLAQVSPRVMN